MKRQLMYYKVFIILGLGILAICITRSALAVDGNPPIFNDLFIFITLAGSLAVGIVGYHCLLKHDCLRHTWVRGWRTHYSLLTNLR